MLFKTYSVLKVCGKSSKTLGNKFINGGFIENPFFNKFFNKSILVNCFFYRSYSIYIKRTSGFEDINSGDKNSGDTNSGDTNSLDTFSVDTSSVDTSSVDKKLILEKGLEKDLIISSMFKKLFMEEKFTELTLINKAKLFELISYYTVDLSNESSLEMFEKSIKELDMKSKAFVNSTDANLIPYLGTLWNLIGMEDYKKGVIKSEGLFFTEETNRIAIQYLYTFLTVIVLQKLINKIIYLYTINKEDELIVDFKVLLNEFLRKVDPRIRKYLRGSRINVIDKIYAGFDTEYETKSYGLNDLLSTQITCTGTIIIRVNNYKEEFDFNKILLADGSKIKDVSSSKISNIIPLNNVTNLIKDCLYDLRTFLENSNNQKFLETLEVLSKKNLIQKTIVTEEYIEYTIPLLKDEKGSFKFVSGFKFHESGTVNPTFTDIINDIKNISSDIVEERYKHFLELLDKDFNVVDSIEPINSNSDFSTGPKVSDISNTSNDFNDSNDFNNSNSCNSDKLYNFIDTSVSSSNIFVKDNKLPSALSKIFSDSNKIDGVLRGDHRKNNLIVFACHFSIADLSILSDFNIIKNKFDNVQNTLTTVKQPFTIMKGTTVILRDTMLLSPSGKGLGDLGVLYNLPKLDVGDYISKMSELRDTNPKLFESYAMRDAEIALQHVLFMEQACFKITGEGNLPPTLASLARRFVFKFWDKNNIDLNGLINFGKYKLSDFNTLFTPKGIQSTNNIALVLPMFMAGFRGGRNESYSYGIDFKEKWLDIDLKSAYSTSMSLLGIPDFEKTLHVVSKKIFNDFLTTGYKELNIENAYSMFKVSFTFPETIIHPSLPVTMNDTNVIYPLEGETIATGYELYLALTQGCNLKLKEGYIIPFKGDTKPYLDVVEFLQKERKQHEVGTLYNLLYKELGNSIYGQIAQGFNSIKRFNTRSNELEGTSTSLLSNPLMASHISALIRGVLGEVINQIEIKGGKIVSCTTDGLLTNLPNIINELDYDSKLLKMYADLREKLSGSRDILEIKGTTEGIISWSVRGQLALSTNSKISAMTGFQPRNYSHKERVDLLLNAFNKEDYEINFGQKTLRKVVDIYKHGGHVTNKVTEKVFRVVYDNRRVIIETGVSPKETLLFTRPLKNIEEGLTLNTISKLGEALYAPKTNYTNKGGSKDYLDMAVRSFLRALTQEKLNLTNPFNNYKEIVDYVNKTFGFEITLNYIAIQKRRKFIPKVVPLNKQTKEIVEKIKINFPNFDENDFLSNR